MKKFLSAALAIAIGATGTVGLVGEAEARKRDRYYSHNYHHDNYRYRRHHNHNGDAVAAGIIGFALGAIVAGQSQRNYVRRDYYARDPAWDHIRRCERRYRSYDRYSDTFLGRDGRRYYCQL